MRIVQERCLANIRSVCQTKHAQTCIICSIILSRICPWHTIIFFHDKEKMYQTQNNVSLKYLRFRQREYNHESHYPMTFAFIYLKLKQQTGERYTNWLIKLQTFHISYSRWWMLMAFSFDIWRPRTS